MLGLKRRLVRCLEWLTLLPTIAVFPHFSHAAIVVLPHSRKYSLARIYRAHTTIRKVLSQGLKQAHTAVTRLSAQSLLQSTPTSFIRETDQEQIGWQLR